MPLSSRFGTATIVASVLNSTAGCAPPSLPSYATVRDETRAAMQQIMDEFPTDAPAQFLPDSDPFACGDGGVFYTGRAGAVQAAGFDGAEFIATLPAALGDDFVEDDLGVDTSFPNVDLRAPGYGDTGVSVFVTTRDGVSSINMTATSRCGEPPA